MFKKSLIAGFELPKEDKTKIKKQLTKINSKTSLTPKKTLSKNISIKDKLDAITKEVMRVLGKYKDNTNVIYKKSDLNYYLEQCIKNGIVAVDTETNNSIDPITCKIMGLCLYTPGMPQVYIPINHVNYITNELLTEKVRINIRQENQTDEEDSQLNFIEEPKQLTEQDLKEFFIGLGDTKIIMHNAKFDIQVIDFTCMDGKANSIHCYWDTMIGARLLNENEIRKGGNYTLKWQYYDKVDHDAEVYNIETFFKNVQYSIVEPEIFALYAATDAYATYKLYEYQKKEYDKEDNKDVFKVFQNIEMQLLPAVVAMEETGVQIDTDFAKRLSEKYHKKLDAINEKIANILDNYSDKINSYKLKNPNNNLSDPILISSPSQLAILLYDILGCDVVDKSKPRGTGEDILKKINNPLCNAILEYRGLQKLLNTYIDKIPEVINPKTNRVHASFNQVGTDTGRFSSSDPNLQNIPSHNKEIRLMFKASPGYVMVGGDFSQQEPRLLASFSKDENMINAYNNKQDLYATVASKVYHKDYWECMEHYQDGTPNPEGKKRRGNIKSIVLGIMYGRGATSIAEQTNQTIEQAKEIIDNFYDGFPKVRNWINETEAFACKYGYVTTLWGRRRRLPDILLEPCEISCKVNKPDQFSPLFEDTSDLKIDDFEKINKFKKLFENCTSFNDRNSLKRTAEKEGVTIKDNNGFIAQAKRQCVNARIQGSAADMSKRAMILIYNNKRLNDLGFRMLFAVHDEITGECPKENAAEVSKLLSELMIQSAKPECLVDMKCDTYLVSRWYEDDFTDLVKSEYQELLSKYKNEEEALTQIKLIHSEISENRLIEICNGTYECAVHEDI